MTGVTGAYLGTSTPYASSVQYVASGDLSSMAYNNGITESHTWNSRFQHTGISAGNLLGLNYSYCATGDATCSGRNTIGPYRQTISIGGQTQAVQEYQHDLVNRLTIAGEHSGANTFTPSCQDSGSAWCAQFNYDNAGNRTIINRGVNGASAPSRAWDVSSFNQSNNRIADANWGYDAVGNISQTPSYSIAYDAENRQVAFCTAAADAGNCPNQVGAGRTVYVYDGLGNRVQRIDQNGTGTTYAYDAFGNLAVEYGNPPPGTAGTTQYLTADHLGTTRLVMTGNQASERHDFEPFGYELDPGTGTWRTGPPYGPGTVRQKFTGQERDTQSDGTPIGLDYFQARYYAPTQGRFTSPDPDNAGSDPSDPQSWNMYAYVSNNPLTYTDPDGLGFWSDLGGFLLNVGLNFLTGGLNNFSVARLAARSVRRIAVPGMNSCPSAAALVDC